MDLPDLIVERFYNGARFAVRIPYEVKGDAIVIDAMTAGGAAHLLHFAVEQKFPELRPVHEQIIEATHGR